MHRHLLIIMLTAVAPLAAQNPDPRVARVDSLFNAKLPTNAVAPGCAVGIRHNGEVVYRRGFGLADIATGAPITPQSVFYTGSISKQFTAISVAMASRDGAIDLDAPANRWITELPPMAAGITVRQMIHHTSGLREKWDLLAMKGVADSVLITQQMVLDLVERQRALNSAPGTRYAYNNTAYDLLATLLERATGKTIRRFSDERIFQPLGMSRTLYADRFGEPIADKVMGYTSANNDSWREFPAMVETVGSGSLHSTLDDMLLWAESFETGLLGDADLQRMVETPGRLADGSVMNYAFGLQVGELGGRKRIGHGGSLVGFRTAIVRLPEERWAGVALCNYAQAWPEQWMNTVALEWLGLAKQPGDDVDTPVLVSPGTPSPAPVEDGVLGRYRSEELDAYWNVVRDGSTMVLRRPGMKDIPFTMGSDGNYRVGGWRIEIDYDPSGQVLALLVGSGRSQGIAFERVR
jgi:CubicO group peptidase (beta-lactamase class C family)